MTDEQFDDLKKALRALNQQQQRLEFRLEGLLKLILRDARRGRDRIALVATKAAYESAGGAFYPADPSLLREIPLRELK